MEKEELKEILSFYILNRKYEKVLELAKQFLKENPDPYIIYIMGLAYEGLNMKNEAIEKFREALSISPDLEEAYEHLKKLVEV